jgi:hypothetical protein
MTRVSMFVEASSVTGLRVTSLGNPAFGFRASSHPDCR